MNCELLRKFIDANEKHKNRQGCTDFVYSNPLLDKNVAKELSKIFVKALRYQDLSTSYETRKLVMENIRKICKTGPQSHASIDENLTELLKRFFEEKLKETNDPSIDQKLDDFLVESMKDLNITSNTKPNLNPEVAQALYNLNVEKSFQKYLITDCIHWDHTDKRCYNILKKMWNNESIQTESDSLTIKLKSEIEIILLEAIETFLPVKSSNDKIISLENFCIKNSSLKSLIKKCSVSPNCFQICTNILNLLLIMTNFNPVINSFIHLFVVYVKLHSSKIPYFTLYPSHLIHIVTLLDIDNNINKLNQINQGCLYIDMAVKCLKGLQEESDTILLLSHFPKWFKFYKDLS